MGKGWKNNDRRGGGNSSKGINDIGSAKGFPCVIGTCDGAREREATKELSNLLNQAIECIYPEYLVESSDTVVIKNETETIQGALAREVESLKSARSTRKELITSVNTGIKGVVLVKITQHKMSAINLVQAVFDRVKLEKQSCSRFVVRLIPLEIVFYPNEEELETNLKTLIASTFSVAHETKLHTINSSTFILNDNCEQTTKKLCIRDDVNSNISNNDDTTMHPNIVVKMEPNITLPAEKTTSADSNPIETSTTNSNSTAGPLNSSTTSANTTTDHQYQIDSNVNPAVTTSTTATPSTNCVSAAERKPNNKIYRYSIEFKRRNNDVISKHQTQSIITAAMPSTMRCDYRNPQGTFIVEALRSICGISFSFQYDEYMQYNLRKFQNQFITDVLPSSAYSTRSNGATSAGITPSPSHTTDTTTTTAATATMPNSLKRQREIGNDSGGGDDDGEKTDNIDYGSSCVDIDGDKADNIDSGSSCVDIDGEKADNIDSGSSCVDNDGEKADNIDSGSSCVDIDKNE